MGWEHETEMTELIKEVYIIDDEFGYDTKLAVRHFEKFLEPYHFIFKEKKENITKQIQDDSVPLHLI